VRLLTGSLEIDHRRDSSGVRPPRPAPPPPPGPRGAARAGGGRGPADRAAPGPAGRAEGRLGRVASPEPARISTNAATIPAVSGSPSTATPRATATAGLT